LYCERKSIIIPKNTFEDLCEMPIFQTSIEKFGVKIIVFEPEKEIILKWKK
jgi:hypothetical protein